MTAACGRCGGPHRARGLCGRCYMRAARRDRLDTSYGSALRLAVDLRLLLDVPGWTRTRVATEAGVTRETVRSVLRCRHQVQADTAARLGAVCHAVLSGHGGVRPASVPGQAARAA